MREYLDSVGAQLMPGVLESDAGAIAHVVWKTDGVAQRARGSKADVELTTRGCKQHLRVAEGSLGEAGFGKREVELEAAEEFVVEAERGQLAAVGLEAGPPGSKGRRVVRADFVELAQPQRAVFSAPASSAASDGMWQPGKMVVWVQSTPSLYVSYDAPASESTAGRNGRLA